jgi:hypothetical protein
MHPLNVGWKAVWPAEAWQYDPHFFSVSSQTVGALQRKGSDQSEFMNSPDECSFPTD